MKNIIYYLMKLIIIIIYIYAWIYENKERKKKSHSWLVFDKNFGLLNAAGCSMSILRFTECR